MRQDIDAVDIIPLSEGIFTVLWVRSFPPSVLQHLGDSKLDGDTVRDWVIRLAGDQYRPRRVLDGDQANKLRRDPRKCR